VKERRGKMPVGEVRKVCIVGVGQMGCVISLQCAVGGYETAVFDISEEALQRAPARQKGMAERLMALGSLSQSEVEAGLARIVFTTDPGQAAKDADLLSEAVPEVLELKRKVHAQFDQLCPPHTIMTTNTSSLLASEIEDVVRRGDRFAALHFHGFRTVVDIMRGRRTSPETVEILQRFVRSLGQIPMVMKKEKDGYLHNTMLIAFLHAAASLVIGGYADVEDVDRAWMGVRGSAAGPFGMMDGIGLDVAMNVAETQAQRGKGESWQQMADFVRPYVERGELGVKTGKGFYTYPNPAYQQPDFLAGKED